MYTKYDFKRSEHRMVYIRPVTVADLPNDMQEQAEGRDHIYGVHSSEGLCLALVKDRNLAFALARQNDLAPVEVH